MAGMVTGLLFTASYIVFFKFINPEMNNADNWFLGISPEGMGMLGMVVNFVVAFAVSKFTAAVPQNVVDMVESIRFPKGSGEAHDH